MTTIPGILLQDDFSGAAGGALFGIGAAFLLVLLAMMVITIVGFWKVFQKAGQPGWAVLIPIYNAYVLLKIAGKPGWWVLLFLIPLVNVVIALIVAIDMARVFGHSAAFGVLLLFFFSGIGYLILGFGNSRYLGPAAAPAN